LRSSLQCLLESVGLQARAFTDIDTFLTVYQPDRPGCLLLDIRVSGRGNPSPQQQLREHGIDVPVIIITGHGNVATAVAAMKQGRAGFHRKTVQRPVVTGLHP
jgi:two-component system response regulator FixJ